MRQKWRKYQRDHREQKRVLADVLNLTPPSLDTSDEQIQHLENPEPMLNHLDDHDYEQPIVERPQRPLNSCKEREGKKEDTPEREGKAEV